MNTLFPSIGECSLVSLKRFKENKKSKFFTSFSISVCATDGWWNKNYAAIDIKRSHISTQMLHSIAMIQKILKPLLRIKGIYLFLSFLHSQYARLRCYAIENIRGMLQLLSVEFLLLCSLFCFPWWGILQFENFLSNSIRNDNIELFKSIKPHHNELIWLISRHTGKMWFQTEIFNALKVLYLLNN